MKALRILCTMLLVAFTAASFAQKKQTRQRGPRIFRVSAWQGARFSFDHTKVVSDMNGMDPWFGETEFVDALNGFSVGYVKAFKLIPNVPLFLEPGAYMNFARWKEVYEEEYEYSDGTERYGETIKLTNLAWTIPINVVFGLRVNDKVVVKPYSGMFFRLNLTAKMKDEWFDEWDNSYDKGRDEGSESLNLMSKDDIIDYMDDDADDIEGEIATWKRFEIGTQFGVTVDFLDQFSASLEYAAAFNEFMKGMHANRITLRVGYNF